MEGRRRLFLAALTLFAGCVPSLHPLFNEADLTFAPELLGSWSEEGSEESWTFSAHEPRSYRLVIRDDEGREGTFTAHLVDLDGKRFLDLYPRELDEGLSELYRLHFVRAHTFFFVEQIEPRLRMSYMDPDWLAGFVEENPGAIRSETVEERIVLTAPTEELQKFFLEHLATPGAFSEPSNLARAEAAG